MQALRWFCGECLCNGRDKARKYTNDVSDVHLFPTRDGGFSFKITNESIGGGDGDTAHKPPGEHTSLPCMMLNATHTVIVVEHCPDNWDAANMSSEIHRV